MLIPLSLSVSLLTSPQDPPTTGILMDKPIVFMAPGTELMLSEVDAPAEPLSTFDDRFAIDDMVPLSMLPAGYGIGSFSRGTGLMFSAYEPGGTPYVFPSVPAGGWSFLLFSVSGTGFDPATAYAEELAAGQSVDGDVYAYVVEGSDSYVPDGQVGTTAKIREGDELDTGGVSSLVGIDSYLPAYSVSDDVGEEVDEEEGDGRLRFYFTIRNSLSASYDGIPLTWCGGDQSVQSQATVFFVEYDDVADTWDGPFVYRSWEQLGLEQTTVIDGLTVMDKETPGESGGRAGIQVLLSTTDRTLARQLWVAGIWTEPGGSGSETYEGPLCTETGTLFVEDELGFNDPLRQRFEANCGDDPGDDFVSSMRHDVRIRRTALQDPDDDSNSGLDLSVHHVTPVSADMRRYRATLQGRVGATDRYAMLVDLTNGGMLTSVSRANGTAPDKQAAFFELKRRYALGEQIVRVQWFVYDNGMVEVGRSPIVLLRHW